MSECPHGLSTQFVKDYGCDDCLNESYEKPGPRVLGLDDCLACQALWAGDDPQYAHVCLACPQCHERPVGVALIVGAYCYKCGWRES